MIKWIKIYLSGICMGAADIVPGVSGGTIAFIMGFYERLISALSGVNKTSFLMLLKGDFKGLWKHFDFGFLIALGAGILSSIIVFSHIITYLLDEYSLYLLSFFFGLIVASSLILLKSLNDWQLKIFAFLVLGLLIGILLSMMPAIDVTNISLMVFLSGLISICAMLLPGISGSFILLMLGMYEVILKAVKNFDFEIIIQFALGAFLGLILFSKLLKYMIKNHKEQTVSLLLGIMLGSLIKVWPWRQVTEWAVLNNKQIAIKETLFMPWNMNGYEVLPHLIYPLLCVIFGFVLIFCSNYIFLHKRLK